MIEAFGLKPASNTLTNIGTLETWVLRVYHRSLGRRVRPPQQILLGSKSPGLAELTESTDPTEVVQMALPHIEEFGQRNLLALSLMQVRKDARRKRAPGQDFLRLDIARSIIIAAHSRYEPAVSPLDAYKKPTQETGELHMAGVDRRFTTTLHPVIFLPAYTSTEESHPITHALQVTGSRDGAIYVARRGLEEVVDRKELGWE